jgi:hypothetical protein
MKLLPLVLLAPTIALAQVFYMPNEAGGEIVLTARDCKVEGKVIKGIYEAYAWSPNSGMIKGCWGVVDGNVHVQYPKDRRVYKMTDFLIRE